MSRILIIQGHPDPSANRFSHALSRAYHEGALLAGHEVREIEVAKIDFPLLRSQEDWQHGELPASLAAVQAHILWAEHLVFFFPLWLGGMPALLKGFLEQVVRPGFALGPAEGHGMPKKLLTGRSARLVVTMGMPAVVYRYVFRAHSLKALERNILGFVGIAPVHETLIGMVDSKDPHVHQRWLARLRALGRKAA
jgi:putative NADPH-quinone reductase